MRGDWLDWVVYGAGTLGILFFLLSAVRVQMKRRKERRMESQTPSLETSAEPNESIHDCEGHFHSDLSAHFEDFESGVTAQLDEPLEDSLEEDTFDAIEPHPSIQESVVESAPPSKTAESLPHSSLVSLLVVAKRGRRFSGPLLEEAFKRQGLQFGEYDIFHCFNTFDEKIFSVASAMKPGTFDLDSMESFSTSGLNFFLDLEASQHPKEDFKRMLGVVHEIASHLNADILDAHRERLTQSSVVEYLARIKGFESSKRPVF